MPPALPMLCPGELGTRPAAGVMEQPRLGQFWGPLQVLAASPVPCATGPGVLLHQTGSSTVLARCCGGLFPCQGTASLRSVWRTAEVLPRMTLDRWLFSEVVKGVEKVLGVSQHQSWSGLHS